MSGPEASGATPPTSEAGFGIPGVPPIAATASNDEKDAHWYKHAYQGDKMPQLTLRAVMTGGILGMLLAASNLYTTLNIGWAFGVAITASVISYVIWSIITPILKCRKMTILETNCMASTASAAGYSTGSTIATMFGALVLLFVIPDNREQRLQFDAVPDKGSFRVSFGDVAPTSTDPIPYNASPAVVQQALEGLGAIEPGDVEVTSDEAGRWNVKFMGKLDNPDIQPISIVKNDTASKLTQKTTGEKKAESAATKTWDIHPVWLVASFTFVTGLMGVFLAIPMKRQMINHEQLPFPSGIAAAETLRSLYSAGQEALRKAYVLILGLGIGAIVAFLRTGEGVFKFLDVFYQKTKLLIPSELHLPVPKYWLEPETYTRLAADKWANPNVPEYKKFWGYGVDTSVLLLAAGMIVGLRVSLSMLAGSLILYFWLGPMLLAQDGAAHAATLAGVTSTVKHIDNIEVVGGGTTFHFARWGLWGGTALMVMASLTALAFQWKTIVRAFMKKDNTSGASGATLAAMDKIEVPFIWMVIGMVPITIAMVIIQAVAFQISWWAGLIAVAMSFVLSLVASRATGETDTTPIGAMGKVMQLLFAVLKPTQVVPNLASAGIAANSASSCADLLTDLKIGYLLGANPRRQFLAQFFGVFFGTVAIVPIWYLMVPTKAALEKLPAPATQTWAKVAQVLTQGIGSLPESARYALVIGGLIGIALPIIEKFLVPAKYRKFMPSAAGLGLAFMLPFYNSLAFTIGAIIAFVWTKWNKRNADTFIVPLASGLVAGESLIAAFIAMLATASGLLGRNL